MLQDIVECRDEIGKGQTKRGLILVGYCSARLRGSHLDEHLRPHHPFGLVIECEFHNGTPRRVVLRSLRGAVRLNVSLSLELNLPIEGKVRLYVSINLDLCRYGHIAHIIDVDLGLRKSRVLRKVNLLYLFYHILSY